MPPAESGLEIVRSGANDGIGDRVNAHGDTQGPTAEGAGYTQDLIIIKKKKDAKRIIFNGIRDCPYTLYDFGGYRDFPPA